jgi:uncharacterized protein YpmB
MLPYIITAVVSIIITALIVWFAAALYQKKSANSKIGNAEEKARGIIDEAAANHTINAVIIIETTAVMIYGSITGAPPLLNFHCISQITTIKFYTFWCKLSR